MCCLIFKENTFQAHWMSESHGTLLFHFPTIMWRNDLSLAFLLETASGHDFLYRIACLKICNWSTGSYTEHRAEFLEHHTVTLSHWRWLNVWLIITRGDYFHWLCLSFHSQHLPISSRWAVGLDSKPLHRYCAIQHSTSLACYCTSTAKQWTKAQPRLACKIHGLGL